MGEFVERRGTQKPLQDGPDGQPGSQIRHGTVELVVRMWKGSEQGSFASRRKADQPPHGGQATFAQGWSEPLRSLLECLHGLEHVRCERQRSLLKFPYTPFQGRLDSSGEYRLDELPGGPFVSQR
jgi:hypothetical protein